MEQKALGWEPLIDSWLNTLPPNLNNNNLLLIKQLFCRFCPPLLWLIREGGVKVSDRTVFENDQIVITRFINS